MAEKGDIVVRLRATNITADESSKLGEKTAAAGLNPTNLYGSPTADLKVDSNTIPELDISYYFTKNIAAELILALGSKHDVSILPGSNGVKNLGEVNLLPPTLTLQWHFNPDQMVDPYVGAGVSYVRAMDNGLDYAGLPIRIDRNNWGVALQGGVDVNLENRWLVNFDVKKIFVDTDVKLNAGAGYTKIDNLDIDPWVVSVGFGKKF